MGNLRVLHQSVQFGITLKNILREIGGLWFNTTLIELLNLEFKPQGKLLILCTKNRKKKKRKEKSFG